MATKPKQDDGDGNDVEDSQDNVIEGNAPLIIKQKNSASTNPKLSKSISREANRTQVERASDLEAQKASTAATKQATAAKATEMAATYRPMGSSYHRNGDGTYTQNAPLSPDAQSDSPAASPSDQSGSNSSPTQEGFFSVASAVTPSRLDAFKARQKNQTDDGGHSWDQNNPNNNPTLQAKMKDAVSGVIKRKLSAGIDPSTNELTGVAPSRDITNSVSNSLFDTGHEAKQRAKAAGEKIASSVADGDMASANKMVPGQQAANRVAGQYADTSEKAGEGKVLITPHGVVSGTPQKLGSGGFDRLMASPSVQDAAKSTNSPAAMAAVTPSPAGSAATATASATPPRQVKQAAYTPPASPLMDGVTPKVKKPTDSTKSPSISA